MVGSLSLSLDSIHLVPHSRACPTPLSPLPLYGSHGAQDVGAGMGPPARVVIKILAKSFCPGKYHKQARFDLLNAGAL